MANNKQGNMTALLTELDKKPMKYGEMQGFLFNRNNPPKAHPKGYNCTNLSVMINRKMIVKNKDLYSLTKLGRKYKNTPYCETVELYKERYNNACDRYREFSDKYYYLLARTDKEIRGLNDLIDGKNNQILSMNRKITDLNTENADMKRLLVNLAKDELVKVISSSLHNNDLLKYLL